MTLFTIPPVQVVPPEELPVTLDEAKPHCRVDHDEDDAVLSRLIAAAVAHLDGYSGDLGRCLIDQDWKTVAGCFPASGYIRLPFPMTNTVAVQSVKYRDLDDVTQTLDGGDYYVMRTTAGNFLARTPDMSWPSTIARADAVEIIATYGFGPSRSAVPEDIKVAILLMVGHWYEHREAVTITGKAAPMPIGADRLLRKYRRVAV